MDKVKIQEMAQAKVIAFWGDKIEMYCQKGLANCDKNCNCKKDEQ